MIVSFEIYLPFQECCGFVGCFIKAPFCKILKKVLITLEINSLAYFNSHISVKVPVEMFRNIINCSCIIIWKDPWKPFSVGSPVMLRRVCFMVPPTDRASPRAAQGTLPMFRPSRGSAFPCQTFSLENCSF